MICIVLCGMKKNLIQLRIATIIFRINTTGFLKALAILLQQRWKKCSLREKMEVMANTVIGGIKFKN